MASPFHSFGFILSLLTILAHVCSSLELVEIRPGDLLGPKSRLSTRDTSLLDLRSTETFLWGADNSSVPLANFTIYAPEDNRNVVSMEKFDGMLLSCTTTRTGLELQFEDDLTFAYAQRVWDWVNGADNHTFLMIVGAGGCSNNPYRVPYSVSDIAYDQDLNIAHLNATTGSWRDLAQSFQLRVGNVATPQIPLGGGLRGRDITKQLSFPLANELPFVAKVEQGPIVGELECENCRTTGQIDFELRVTQNAIGLPDGIELKMSPKGVSAVANLKLKLGSNFKSKKEVFKETVLSFPLNGITIPPDILNIGPFLDIDAGVEVTGVEGSITVSGGVTSKISDSAILRANLFDPLDNEFSGWLPDINFVPPTIEAQVSATLQMFFMPALRLKAEALGKGVEAGLELKLPFIDLKLEATANSNGGVCDDPAKTVGVEIEPSIGAEFKFEAGTTDGEKTPVEVTIATTSSPLGGICFGTNPDGGDDELPPTSSSKPKPPTTKSSTKTSTATSAPVAKCTANNGLFGSCISTSTCSKQGGVSEPGHCSGGTDIQCCYRSDGSGDSCKTDDGISGTCMSTGACSNAKAQSIPGFCAGPTSIQCCIPEAAPPATSNTCVLPESGVSGECISTGSCSSLGGKSTAGFCPGAADIQCCTYSTCFVGMQEGICQPTSTCKGSTHAGLCSGGNNIQCCTK